MKHFKIKGGLPQDIDALAAVIQAVEAAQPEQAKVVGPQGNAVQTEVLDNLGVELVTAYDSGIGEGGSEVVSYFEGKLYVTNGEQDRIDIIDASTGLLLNSVDLSTIPGYDGLNSVAVSAAGIAVAVERENTEIASEPMLVGEEGWTTAPIFTVGASLDNGYTPPGILDGIGAIKLNDDTVRVFVNHEMGSNDGYAYEVDGIELTGARISYFDIDIATKSIIDGGPAIQQIVDAAGNVATDTSFTFENKAGFERFCSSVLFEADTFGEGQGLVDNIYFTGEETGGAFSGTGGAEWALDIETGTIYALPAFGRGAWENVTQVDTGTDTHVAFVLADDTSPFDADGDGNREGAPVYLYVGEKSTDADAGFLARNGLEGGKLYVWTADSGALDPSDFNGTGNSAAGAWVEIDNSPNLALADEFGANGYDEFGYPTQKNLWTQAKAVGAFQMSRPEDVATNPADGTQIVFASTGRAGAFGGADEVGTTYIIDLDFTDINAPTATTTILYDGDDDPAQALRSPDNLDWADDGMIYVQEDRANGDLFDADAPNQNDASIVRIDPTTGEVTRVAFVDQAAHYPIGSVEENFFYTGAKDNGDWESSGILDVSTLFGEAPGTLFLADVQAHGLDDQDRFDVEGPGGQITDDNLREGGQLLFLAAPGVELTVENPVDPVYAQNGVVALFDLDGTPKGTVEAGNLPDMVTFSKDGTMIFVANEGEKQADQDPAGSISIIDVATMTAQTFGFEQFNADIDALREAGVRIFPGETPATDFEPEYIAEAGGKLFVTLQEANAVAVFDLTTMGWEKIVPLGTQDHSVVGLDASDKDGAINITTYDNLVGLRMPDAIAAAEINGQTYFLTANEGDDRGDFDEGGDAARVGDILDGDVAGLSIDPSVDTTGLERLNVSIIDGDTDGDGDIDVLHSYGSRSFTIYDADGNLVFDSGSDFEQIIAATRVPNAFNNDDYPSGDPSEVDENRSDNKGPEPEAIAVGVVEGKTLAFIGLERDSGIMIYDISDPANSQFVDYIESGAMGHISPEVIDFIPAEESTSGIAQIAVSYEVSGTTAVFDLEFGKEITGSRKADVISGTIGDDEISGGNGRDTIDGNGGDDVILGGNGKDCLSGGAGDDTIDGGNGRDKIIGGLGDDLLTGGNGMDCFVFNFGDGNDTITDLQRNDKIDLSGTGLEFADLTVTELSNKEVHVAYGDQGDALSIELTFAAHYFGEDSFLF
ncbi:choice-of-anchor I family protein [Actibacterium sp. XHP0104]|uniref:choice-of-anchor I family protein n=1 Tax=Actibacterium sp. XHP0104 TaxID=2984335 RepID=UPI0021E79058|nr:choice-of-anchor I family protein [Actibacterium sp. XHP0104]MCV2880424.1 choice-of-anchor I family protein [Actibacterium sp. XHP0104]